MKLIHRVEVDRVDVDRVDVDRVRIDRVRIDRVGSIQWKYKSHPEKSIMIIRSRNPFVRIAR